MAQHAFAEVAAERATDPRVRALARDLVDYHTRSYDRLVQLPPPSSWSLCATSAPSLYCY